jgi:hypothetical protein
MPCHESDKQVCRNKRIKVQQGRHVYLGHVAFLKRES